MIRLYCATCFPDKPPSESGITVNDSDGLALIGFIAEHKHGRADVKIGILTGGAVLANKEFEPKKVQT